MTVEIISIILNAVLASGFIVTLVTLKAQRKKAGTEASQAEVDLVASSVKSMIESQKALMLHNQELIEALTASRRENQQLSDKIDELEKKINSMLATNRQIVNLLKKLKVDESYIKLIEKDA
ncbi:MAG: hypothetical protein PHG67_06155 [Bacteroidales bacterium]|jgi:predicted RNase H-like nuclease (RuvC/YqgF family)|nr:hypothetical protein [Bacteroidales bacterium]HOI32971.1 hypothetical protein [Bacteroidales bacterium]